MTKHNIKSTLSLGMGNERADAVRDGRICLQRPNSQAPMGTGEKIFSLFSLPRAGFANISAMPSLLSVMTIHTYVQA